MKKEIWKEVSGYGGSYQVSDIGRIKSMSRRTKSGRGHLTIKEYPERIMKVRLCKHGYLAVLLSKDGVYTHKLIHRLVAKAFIDNPDKKETVNHKNGIKTDNSVGNIEWSTKSENIQHAFDTGLKTVGSGYGNHLSKEVNQFSKDGNLLKQYGSIREAERETGIRNSNISGCCVGRVKSAGGFIWKHK